MTDEEPRIAPARILAPKLWEEERQHAKDYFEVEFKAVGYLLAAHGAGLAACMALLKDYATTPYLKGVGVFISCFGLGFILAISGFIALSAQRREMMNVFLEGRPKSGKSLSLAWSLILTTVSCLCLTGAVALIIGKFAVL